MVARTVAGSDLASVLGVFDDHIVGRVFLAATDDDGVGQADVIDGLEGADADDRVDDW